MSDTFYKTIKKREQEEKFERRKQESISLMSNYVTKANADEFFHNFLGHLEKTVPEQQQTLVG